MVRFATRFGWVVALPLCWASPSFAATYQYPFQDPSLTFDQRVDDLVGRLTDQEKISQLVNSAAAIDRLGIPAYDWWNEGIHGYISSEPDTVFPQAIGMSASWDKDMMSSVGKVISDDARSIYNDALRKNPAQVPPGITLWTPNINIYRDPRWGRGQETYGEDPFLTGSMVVPLIHALQGDDPRYLKVVSTPKHFAVHSGPDALRDSFDAEVTQKDLWETYFPAFRSAIVEGKAYSIMSSYNAVNGIPSSVNPELFDTALRGAWKFQGYAVSDCDAISDIFATHDYITDPAKASAAALRNGVEIDCGTTYTQYLPEALTKGYISEQDLNTAAKRIMKARFLLGMFDPPSQVPWSPLSEATVDGPPNRELARQVARESMVLLKNDNGLLPLDPKRYRRIAVIGPNADRKLALEGDYTGHSLREDTPLTALTAWAQSNGARLSYSVGSGLTSAAVLTPVDASMLFTDQTVKTHGLSAQYFTNQDLQGTPALQRVDTNIDFDWSATPPPGIPHDHYSVRWQGYLEVPESGDYQVGIETDDGGRLYLNDNLIVDQWSDHSAIENTATVTLKAGQPYALRMEYYQDAGSAVAQLLIETRGVLQQAVAAAKSSDVALVFLGLSPEIESEGLDRTDIVLPDGQLALLQAVQATGTPTVLVFMNGGPVSDSWSAANTHAILEAWYPGEEGGEAITDVLFGNYSPAGRLPVTIYRSLSDLPDFTNYNMTNRTYRYFTGTPLYKFGDGLSYTTFQYDGLRIEKPTVNAGDTNLVSVNVTNTGTRDSDEVVELYLSHAAGDGVPVRSLRGFTRVSLRAGETKSATFTLDARGMSATGSDGHAVVADGPITVTVGGRQPRGDSDMGVLRGTFNVAGPAVTLPL